MSKIVNTLVVLLLGGLGVAVACEDDCSNPKDVERGTFQIDESTGGAPTSGTIEIREKNVEIVYTDDDENAWHVVYRIVKEEAE